MHLHRSALDAQLAAGADPDSASELALRAGQLTSRSHRRRLADSLDDIVALAEGGRPRVSSVPPIRLREVRAARAALLGLARDLRRDGLVAAAGVAQTQRMLTDGTGPLYVTACQDGLWQAARNADEALAC